MGSDMALNMVCQVHVPFKHHKLRVDIYIYISFLAANCDVYSNNIFVLREAVVGREAKKNEVKNSTFFFWLGAGW